MACDPAVQAQRHFVALLQRLPEGTVTEKQVNNDLALYNTPEGRGYAHGADRIELAKGPRFYGAQGGIGGGGAKGDIFSAKHRRNNQVEMPSLNQLASLLNAVNAKTDLCVTDNDYAVTLFRLLDQGYDLQARLSQEPEETESYLKIRRKLAGVDGEAATLDDANAMIKKQRVEIAFWKEEAAKLKAVPQSLSGIRAAVRRLKATSDELKQTVKFQNLDSQDLIQQYAKTYKTFSGVDLFSDAKVLENNGKQQQNGGGGGGGLSVVRQQELSKDMADYLQQADPFRDAKTTLTTALTCLTEHVNALQSRMPLVEDPKWESINWSDEVEDSPENLKKKKAIPSLNNLGKTIGVTHSTELPRHLAHLGTYTRVTPELALVRSSATACRQINTVFSLVQTLCKIRLDLTAELEEAKTKIIQMHVELKEAETKGAKGGGGRGVNGGGMDRKGIAAVVQRTQENGRAKVRELSRFATPSVPIPPAPAEGAGGDAFGDDGLGATAAMGIAQTLAALGLDGNSNATANGTMKKRTNSNVGASVMGGGGASTSAGSARVASSPSATATSRQAANRPAGSTARAGKLGATGAAGGSSKVASTGGAKAGGPPPPNDAGPSTPSVTLTAEERQLSDYVAQWNPRGSTSLSAGAGGNSASYQQLLLASAPQVREMATQTIVAGVMGGGGSGFVTPTSSIVGGGSTTKKGRRSDNASDAASSSVRFKRDDGGDGVATADDNDGGLAPSNRPTTQHSSHRGGRRSSSSNTNESDLHGEGNANGEDGDQMDYGTAAETARPRRQSHQMEGGSNNSNNGANSDGTEDDAMIPMVSDGGGRRHSHHHRSISSSPPSLADRDGDDKGVMTAYAFEDLVDAEVQRRLYVLTNGQIGVDPSAPLALEDISLAFDDCYSDDDGGSSNDGGEGSDSPTSHAAAKKKTKKKRRLTSKGGGSGSPTSTTSRKRGGRYTTNLLIDKAPSSLLTGTPFAPSSPSAGGGGKKKGHNNLQSMLGYKDDTKKRKGKKERSTSTSSSSSSSLSESSTNPHDAPRDHHSTSSRKKSNSNHHANMNTKNSSVSMSAESKSSSFRRDGVGGVEKKSSGSRGSRKSRRSVSTSSSDSASARNDDRRRGTDRHGGDRRDDADSSSSFSIDDDDVVYEMGWVRSDLKGPDGRAVLLDPKTDPSNPNAVVSNAMFAASKAKMMEEERNHRRRIRRRKEEKRRRRLEEKAAAAADGNRRAGNDPSLAAAASATPSNGDGLIHTPRGGGDSSVSVGGPTTADPEQRRGSIPPPPPPTTAPSSSSTPAAADAEPLPVVGGGDLGRVAGSVPLPFYASTAGGSMTPPPATTRAGGLLSPSPLMVSSPASPQPQRLVPLNPLSPITLTAVQRKQQQQQQQQEQEGGATGSRPGTGDSSSFATASTHKQQQPPPPPPEESIKKAMAMMRGVRGGGGGQQNSGGEVTFLEMGGLPGALSGKGAAGVGARSPSSSLFPSSNSQFYTRRSDGGVSQATTVKSRRSIAMEAQQNATKVVTAAAAVLEDGIGKGAGGSSSYSPFGASTVPPASGAISENDRRAVQLNEARQMLCALRSDNTANPFSRGNYDVRATHQLVFSPVVQIASPPKQMTGHDGTPLRRIGDAL